MRSFSTVTLPLVVLALLLCGSDPGAARAEWRWGIGLTGGYETSSKLYRVRSDQEVPPPVWTQPGGNGTVTGEEIRAEVQGFASFGGRITAEHGSGWGGILSVTLSDLDVDAIRRTVSQNVDTVPWDQFFVINVQAVGTWSWLREGDTPYLLAGVGMSSLNSEGPELDQTAFGPVIGAGYRFHIGRMFQFDLEIRDAIVAVDLDDEEARLREDVDVSSFEGEDRIHLFEVSGTISLMF